jgi:hypothetical protein
MLGSQLRRQASFQYILFSRIPMSGLSPTTYPGLKKILAYLSISYNFVYDNIIESKQ